MLVFYRPPTKGINKLVALNNCLLSIAQFPIVLCGDFNSVNWSITFPAVSFQIVCVIWFVIIIYIRWW